MLKPCPTCGKGVIEVNVADGTTSPVRDEIVSPFSIPVLAQGGLCKDPIKHDDKFDGSKMIYNSPAVLICSDCGKPIRDGDVYQDMLNEQYCVLCAAKRLRTARKVVE